MTPEENTPLPPFWDDPQIRLAIRYGIYMIAFGLMTMFCGLGGGCQVNMK